ncbi:protein cornichon homolog 1 isoform X2 [Ziziphus jujuba]|uniref:Protein cornichon homolog 1 isoform X2 n=1 Tax=Ziziphus jujuba TaxID=326968 RepID=A0A6P4ATU5_ZIZJJ|nr:protein cornichon homolog 1 isoform X2 [Ziziphus jujuba]
MSWDLIFWIICFAIDLGLLASTFYQLVILTDLEADYINPFESSSRINSLVYPEFIVHGVLCALFLLTWHWFLFLITLPMSAYFVMLFLKRKHLVDVTEVFRLLNAEKRLRKLKLAFYLGLLVIIIFRLTLSAFNSLTNEEDAVNIF